MPNEEISIAGDLNMDLKNGRIVDYAYMLNAKNLAPPTFLHFISQIEIFF